MTFSAALAGAGDASTLTLPFMRSHRAIVALLSVIALHSASAQIDEPRPGRLVRITAPGVVSGRLVGTVLSRTNDTLTIGPEDSPPLAVATSRITAIDVNRGSSRAGGALRGIEVAAPIGLGLGLLSMSAADCTDCWTNSEPPTRAEWVMASMVDCAAVGALIGAVVGRDRWESLDVAPRTSFDVRGGRATLVVAFRF